MQQFRNLTVWRKSHELALEVYRSTQRFPSEERYGLVSQLRRAAISIPTNIAEGSKRKHPRDYARFLNISEGSASELEYLLLVSQDLGYLAANTAEGLIGQAVEAQRMLNGLRLRVEEGISSTVAESTVDHRLSTIDQISNG
jgi:four helix bundle protein